MSENKLFEGMSIDEVAEIGYAEGQRGKPFNTVNLIETLIGWLIHLKGQATCDCEICQAIQDYLGK